MATTETIVPNVEHTPVRRRGPWLTDRRMAWLFISPTVLILLAISIFPLIWSLGLSFTNYIATGNVDPITGAKEPARFVGLRNYHNLLTNNDLTYDSIWHQFTVSALMVIGSVTIEFLLGFGLALLLVRKFPGRGLILTLMLTPMMLAPVVVGLFWRFMFDPGNGAHGILNNLIIFFGLLPLDISRSTPAIVAVIIADVWMWTPFMLLITVAGLAAIPRYLYEAAEVDRASAWFRFRHITLPLVWPLVLIALLFRTIDAIKLFDLYFSLDSGAPANSNPISYVIYTKAFEQYDTGSSSALAYIVLVIVIALANIYIRNLTKAQAAH
jgi:multiple sugar transport system permease protein